ncbi:DUF5753 domain-containing protein [Spirillospora sp. NPDC049652]
MLRRETLDPEGSIAHALAVHLHFLRIKHGYSCAAVGRYVNAARQTVSHWESALRRPDEWQAKKLDELYDTGALIQWLLRHAKGHHDSAWFKAHLDLEAKADVIRSYECNIIPGLLQTEDYARAVFTALGEPDVEGEVRLRMQRQERLRRPNPPRLWFLLEEEIIERPVGGPAVAREQLAKLEELSVMPWVVLRIVPRSAGYHPGLRGSFKEISIGREKAAYTEAAAGGRLTSDSVEVGRISDMFNLIGADALSRGETREKLRRAQELLT